MGEINKNELDDWITREPENDLCLWIIDNDSGAWETECSNLFFITDGTPTENEMKYCCFCGKTIVE
jgi:hypothetical protein